MLIIAYRKKPTGFTLIEVLLAMAITAMIALLAYSGLSSAINAAEGVEAQAEQLADVQLTLSVIEKDIRQAVKRGIRSAYDDESPLSGGALEEYFLVLTRSGWDNPTEIRRGELQRVRYKFENSELQRESWLVLDRVSEDEGLQSVVVYKGITEITISFLDPNSSGASQSPLGGEWVEEWPTSASPDALPRAIDLTIEFENFGPVRRVYEITGP